MFYHLFYNSNYIIDNDDINNKMIKVLIYGTVLYIITHGFINNLFHDSSLTYYFWLIFLLDIMSIGFSYTINNNGNIKINISENFYNNSIIKVKEEQHIPIIMEENELNISTIQESPLIMEQPTIQTIPTIPTIPKIIELPKEVNKPIEKNYIDNKYKLTDTNLNEFTEFMKTIDPKDSVEKKESNIMNFNTQINKNTIKSIDDRDAIDNLRKVDLFKTSDNVKNHIEKQTIKNVNNINNSKTDSDIDYDLETFNSLIE
jgi:hypothetical protein